MSYRVASATDRDPGPGWTNRLVDETSPYLRQHAHNPVDWYPWGDAAFAAARERDRPILVSIGYAACHWCHVMEHESFADPDVAAFLNEHFVAVKVDREERPDIDAIYIEALLTIEGQAGWPANLFLHPDLRPFSGATYLPPQPRYGRPSFLQVLERVTELWNGDRTPLTDAAVRLTEAVGRPLTKGDADLDADGFRRAILGLQQLHDDEHGGLGHGQKFPQTPTLELLLAGADQPGAARILRETLDAMRNGGLHDHLGGGFHRYCVDRRWTVPHFEKMLYDNAQLLRVFARASSLFSSRTDVAKGSGLVARPYFAAVRADIRAARRCAAYLLRDLGHPEGGLCTSEDADDPGGEGFFYTFTLDELPDGVDSDVFGITERGNFEGRTVLSTWDGTPSDAVIDALLAVRATRERPALDDKRVVAWNGLGIGALAEAGRLFGDPSLVEAAASIAELVLAARDADGRLPRLLGSSDVPGVLEDHAFVADGLLDLYQARPAEHRWLREALALAEVVLRDFTDETDGLLQSRPRPDLIVARKEYQDGSEPSGNGRFADVVRRLHSYGALDRTALDGILAAASGLMARRGIATPELWRVARQANEARIPQLVIAGDPADKRTRALLRVWNKAWRPGGIVAVVPPGFDAGPFALLRDKEPDPHGGPLAWLCFQGTCRLPTADAQLLERALLEVQPSADQ